ncbi:low molecular weight protein tyrosine phosphatase family protein [Catalinimonas alkaloidigena]|nr:low molecular weight protein tyrosine phosphatase family protein [Catalinimonas alkaloidigena]
MKNVLFVCSRNRLRSPTAERIFAEEPDLQTASAGLSPDAEEQLTPEHLAWADVVIVMESMHRRKLAQRFRTHLRGKRVRCLDIPDRYAYMDPDLIHLLRRKVPPLLR